jgi:DNA-binding MarR family transcriptional regulator
VDDDADAARILSHELIRFGRLLHLLKAQLTHLLPAGLDPAASQLLAWLVKQGPSRQGELAECTFLDPSTVSRRISQLVAQGLVERQADNADGRAVQLVPTEAGRALFQVIQHRREEIMQTVIASWDTSDLVQLGALLRRLNDDFEINRFGLKSPVSATRGSD